MIHQATLDDLPEIAKIGSAFYAENGVAGQYDAERAIRTWWHFMTHLNGVIFSWTEKGRIVGSISAFLTPDIYTLRIVAQECFWYVLPEYRHTTISLRLFYELEEWAEDSGADEFRVGYQAGPHADSLQKFFQKRGFRPFETHLTKELKSCQSLSH
jgi:GNAT superfamily N-acetyltransferase